MSVLKAQKPNGEISPAQMDEQGRILVTPMYGNPFDFPFGGNSKNVSRAGVASVRNTALELLDVPTGNSGVIRKINFIVSNGGGAAATLPTFPHFSFNIEYDGEEIPSVSIPLNDLFAYGRPDGYQIGNDYTFAEVAGIIPSIHFNTEFFELIDNDKGVQFHISLKYQIPYTNGIHIYVQRDDEASVTNLIFWTNLSYQDSLPSCWNRNLRFLVNRSDESVVNPANGPGTIMKIGTTVSGSGTNFQQSDVGKYICPYWDKDQIILSVESATGLTTVSTDIEAYSWKPYVISSASHTFIERPIGASGYIAAVFGAMDTNDIDDRTILEALTRFYIDQETVASMKWSGTEDFFQGDFYFNQHHQGIDGGVTVFPPEVSSPPYDYSMYRTFRECPIKYSNGIRGVENNSGTGGTAVDFNWTTIYYEFQD